MKVATSLRWLFLDLNSYFASVEQQLNPALRGRPIAVAPTDTDSTCAIAASYEAKAYGVKTGTKIYEARKMCPDLVVVQAQHEAYVHYHHLILKAIDRYIPVTRVCSIDEVACSLMGNEQEPDKATALAKAIKAGIQREVGECLRSSVGIAPNAFLAKVASDMQKPDGLTIIHPDTIYEQLVGLPLTDLPGIGRNMIVRLMQAGVPDMATFWALAPKQARAIWRSVGGEKMWMEPHGYDIPTVPTKRSSIGHSHMLAPSLRRADAAYQVTRRLLAKAASRLRRMEMFTSVLVLSARVEDGPRYAFEISFVSTQDSFALLASLATLWARLKHEVPRAVRFKKVAVTLLHLQPTSEHVPDLFDPPATALRQIKRPELSAALDELNARYGRDTIAFGRWQSNAVNRDTGTKIAFTRIPDEAEFHE